MDSIEKIKVDKSVQRVADAISSYVKLNEAKPEYEVKYAKSKSDSIK